MVVGSNPTGCKNIVQIHTKGVLSKLWLVTKKVEKAQVLKNVEEQKDSNV